MDAAPHAQSSSQVTAAGSLVSAGFLGLLGTQFLTALNDNIFRWLAIGIGKDHVAAYLESQGGKKLVLVFDGPFRWFDARSIPSAKKYPHGVVEIDLDGSGKGQGRLLAGAKVDFAGGAVQVGEAAAQQLRVIQVSTAG